MKNRNLILLTFVLVAALSRLLPHPPNFTTIGAMALFGGAYFIDKKWAILVPIFCMLFTDSILQGMYMTGTAVYPGFTAMMPYIYVSFALIVGLGYLLRDKINFINTTIASLSASTLFFIISNFGVWASSTFYPKNLAGLGECYIAAIPFFHYTMIGDLVYVGIMFGMFEWMKSRNPKLAYQRIK